MGKNPDNEKKCVENIGTLLEFFIHFLSGVYDTKIGIFYIDNNLL